MGLWHPPVLIMLLRLCCAKNEKKVEDMPNPIPKENVPLNTLHIDFIESLPSPNKNYNHIFSFVEAFSKFFCLYPLKSASPQDALQKLKFHQSFFGIPSKIITDRGVTFTSNDFEGISARKKKFNKYSELSTSREETDKPKECSRF